MKIAVSNIAWPAEEESIAAATMQALAVPEVEIAPTKTFDQPLTTSFRQRADYRKFWSDHGVRITAFQSMLFGRLDLEIFRDAQNRRETLEYLSRFLELAGQLDVGRLVFGSPKNRQVPAEMSQPQAFDIAELFFRKLGAVALDNGTCLCIEPNPEVYDCNFVTNATQGSALVSRVAHPGFRLHLDSAGMTLAGDDVAESITAAGSLLAHYHASAPNLGPIEDSVVDHAAAAQALRALSYSGTVSIEMRAGAPGEAPERIRAAVGIVTRRYSD